MSRPVEIERVTHVPGELLRSRDLCAQARSAQQLMWWHQRAVHEAGIVSGLTVHVELGGGAFVAPGVAFDPRGRELVLEERAPIELPDEHHFTLMLVLQRCGDRPSKLAWVRADRLERCDGVPLATLVPGKGGGLFGWPGRARPLARPRLGFGATLPGSTAWLPWLALERLGHGFGLETRVDTRAARLQRGPVLLRVAAVAGRHCARPAARVLEP